MQTLLRSVFRADPADDLNLLTGNAQELKQSRFQFPEHSQATIWEFIERFLTDHNHVPDWSSLDLHFTQTDRSPDVLNQLQIIRSLSPVFRGDFKKRLADKVEARRTKDTEELYRFANQINRTGAEIVDERGRKTYLYGYRDSFNYVTTQGLQICRPTTGIRKEGEVTSDTHEFWEDYERRRDDPNYGRGQLCGIQQIDEAVGGARRDQLWTHAAFTGELKCLTSDTRIQDAETGLLLTVQEIYEKNQRPLVQCLEEDSWSLGYARVGEVVQNAEVPIYRITTDRGRSIRVSGNHPFMTTRGWINAENLVPEVDSVATPGQWSPLSTKSPYRDEEISLVGYLLGDGCLKGYISFTNSDPKTREHFVQCLESLGYVEGGHAEKNHPTYRYLKDRLCYRVSHNPGDKYHPHRISPLRILLDRLGLWGCGAYEKHIPEALWSMNDSQVWKLLASLWDTDGCIFTSSYKGKRKISLYYSTVSEALARDVQYLLHRVGVQSTVRRYPLTYRGILKHCWQVKVMSCSWHKFLTFCPFIGKGEQAKQVLTLLPKVQSDPLFPSSLLEDVDDSVCWRTSTGNWRYVRWAKRRKSLKRSALREIAQYTENEDLLRKSEGGILWEAIESIVQDGVEMTYDLSVPGPRNFVANGFIVHNSTFAFNWVYNQAIYFGFSSLFFSLEMPYDQCQRILYTMHSLHEDFNEIRMELGIQDHPHVPKPLSYKYIRDGKLDSQQERFLKNYILPDLEEGGESGRYGKLHFRGYDPDSEYFRVSDIRAKGETLYRENPFDLMVVDHVLLVDPRKNHQSTTEAANEVVRDLKKLSEVFMSGEGMALLALFQISREGKKRADKANGRYSKYDLSYSNEIERSSDIITASYLNNDLVRMCRALFQFLKARDDGSPDPFYTRIDWATRRLFTCFEKPGDENVESLAEEVDEMSSEELLRSI